MLWPFLAGWILMELFAYRSGWGVIPGAIITGLLIGAAGSFGPTCVSWIRTKRDGTRADRDGLSQPREAQADDVCGQSTPPSTKR